MIIYYFLKNFLQMGNKPKMEITDKANRVVKSKVGLKVESSPINLKVFSFEPKYAIAAVPGNIPRKVVTENTFRLTPKTGGAIFAIQNGTKGNKRIKSR